MLQMLFKDHLTLQEPSLSSMPTFLNEKGTLAVVICYPTLMALLDDTTHLRSYNVAACRQEQNTRLRQINSSCGH